MGKVLAAAYPANKMKRLGVSVVVSLIALVLRVGADGSAAAADWSTVTTPAPGPTQSIGFYSAGCLQGATALPPPGTAPGAVVPVGDQTVVMSSDSSVASTSA